MPEPALFSLRDISFSYGSLQVIFGVDLHVNAGETLALLGTNGAGKSTLLRVAAGLETPSAGTVSLDGADVTRSGAEDRVRRGVVLVAGGRALFGDLTVDENLRIAGTTLASAARVRDRSAAMFELFPILGERRRQLAGSLSGGQQQMLALAKGLLVEPRVLMIDELSLGLAPVVVEELLGVVRRIATEGTTMIVVEQSLTVACEMADRAVFMEKGMVRFEGAARDLLERDDLARSVFFAAGER
jgi:ABC-type branched-subunit amino acid transport system ATPase component